jgi:hypothetical protein
MQTWPPIICVEAPGVCSGKEAGDCTEGCERDAKACEERYVVDLEQCSGRFIHAACTDDKTADCRRPSSYPPLGLANYRWIHHAGPK